MENWVFELITAIAVSATLIISICKWLKRKKRYRFTGMKIISRSL